MAAPDTFISDVKASIDLPPKAVINTSRIRRTRVHARPHNTYSWPSVGTPVAPQITNLLAVLEWPKAPRTPLARKRALAERRGNMKSERQGNIMSNHGT